MRSASAIPALALTATLAAILVACGASGTGGSTGTPAGSPAPTPTPAFEGLVIDIVADGFKFSKAELEVPAGAPFRILLDNRDNETAHGVAIGVGDNPAAAREAQLVYKGAILPGPGIQTYDVPALAPGTYWFFCQPHASMNGTIVVK